MSKVAFSTLFCPIRVAAWQAGSTSQNTGGREVGYAAQTQPTVDVVPPNSLSIFLLGLSWRPARGGLGRPAPSGARTLSGFPSFVSGAERRVRGMESETHAGRRLGELNPNTGRRFKGISTFLGLNARGRVRGSEPSGEAGGCRASVSGEFAMQKK